MFEYLKSFFLLPIFHRGEKYHGDNQVIHSSGLRLRAARPRFDSIWLTMIREQSRKVI